MPSLNGKTPGMSLTNGHGPVYGANQGRGEEHDTYLNLRAKALEKRKSAKPGETPALMKDLYNFWSDCLLEKFNVRMYEDFRSCALEDGRLGTPSKYGLTLLLGYYQEILFAGKERLWNSGKPYPAVFSPHYAEAQQALDPDHAVTNGQIRA